MSWPNNDSDHLMVSANQMANIEKSIISSGLPVPALMEKVGNAISQWLLQRPEMLANGVIVLVGPGHNGGDGLVVARELHLSGIKVSFWCPLKINKSLTLQQLSHVRWLGIKELDQLPDVSKHCLWIDALFGLGQIKPLPYELGELFDSRENSCPGNLISIDIPSGICSDNGNPINNKAAYAAFTLTIGLIKKGLIQDKAIPYVGEIVKIDIGLSSISNKIFPKEESKVIIPNDIKYIPFPIHEKTSMKYERGRLLVIAGCDKYQGAAMLALKGAIASGVGITSFYSCKTIQDKILTITPEVVNIKPIQSGKDGIISLEKSFREIDLNNFDSILIGPGIGQINEEVGNGFNLFEKFKGLIVIDADGINRLAVIKDGLKFLQRRIGPTWLTPHKAEFSRLFPHLKDLPPIQSAKEAAKLTGAGILLKGAHSLIASPNGSTWQIGESASWCARAGLGDLLAGFSSGFGAIGVASSQKIENYAELLAISAFLHAESARRSQAGSSASVIAVELAKLTTQIQAEKHLD